MEEKDLQTDNNLEKVKIGQISSLEKEKSMQKLSENIESGFKIHSMPSGFRSGQFNSSVHPNDLDSGGSKTSSGGGSHKKVGLIIISVGVLVLAVLGYFVYAYVFNSDNSNQDSQNIVRENKPIEQNNKEIVSDNKELEDVTPEEEIEVEEEVILEELEAPTSTDISPEPGDLATSTDNDIESPTSTEPVDEVPTSTPIIVVSDLDGDGLTDLEEAILNTDSENVDTDGDSYSDFVEFSNLYNPLGEGSLDSVAKVLNAYNLADYSNEVYNYSMLYPEAFEVQETEDKSSVMFIDPTNEGFFQISVEPNVEGLDIKAWYEKEFELEELPVNQYYSDESRELVFSPDGLYIYLTDNIQQRIYIISYVSLAMQPAYPNVFSYCADSFWLE
ncbi:MAG: hypothetical protein K9M44_00970 [Candidatus Pacebacteria bacterium]|nr:hypothetical protein [Candidatus Paceibacterota bacterium]